MTAGFDLSQEIYNPDILNLIHVLIETLSEKIRFFIVEMRSLPAFLEDYIAEGTAACIGTEDLKFSQSDIEMLLERTIDTEFQKRAAELIYFYTEGWPVGVVQIMQQIRRQRKKITLDIIEKICETLEVSDYLTTRVYKMLPFDIQTFLKKTAVLDYMTAPVCNSILGSYQSESLLKYLVKEKLFVQSLGDESGIYRYHSIFQRFLLSQISWQEQTDSLKKAAYFFLKTEDKIQAAEYGCRGKVTEVVQAVLEVNGEKMIRERLYDTLEHWFAFLHQAGCEMTSKTRFVYGKYLWAVGQPDKGREQILEAGKAFYEEGRLKDYKKVLLFIAASERKEGNLKQAELCILQIRKSPEKYWDTLTEMVCTELVKYACCLQQMDEAKTILKYWSERGVVFQRKTFLFAAKRVLCDGEEGGWDLEFRELEEGFLLRNCMLAERMREAYHAADFSSVSEYARQIIQNATYETLQVAIAWKMLALLSWNTRNYRKAIEQAGIGDKFLYRNQIQLQDFMEKHRHILEEIDSLHKNARNIRPLLSQKKETMISESGNTGKIYIQCMKQFRVILPDRREVKWRTKKAQELFAYLFHLQGSGVGKEALIALLWPETGMKSATALLHTTLYSIRQFFVQEGWENLIVYEKKKYALNMQMITSDLEELQNCFQEFQKKKEYSERIVQLYAGSYMGNAGYLWAYGMTKKLEDEYLIVCKMGVAECMKAKREDLAIPFLQKMQQIEPYDEETITNLLICLYRSGKQGEAKRQYDSIVKLYKEDLELDFEKSFQEIVNGGR